MDEKYKNLLSSGINNRVIALSKTEVAKIFEGKTRAFINSEAEKMRYANNINNLICRFQRLDYDDENKWDLLIMERIHGIEFRSFEIGKRETFFETFEADLKELHRKGFVHRDLHRPSSDHLGEKYDNILLTTEGLRLIDVGISAIKSTVGDTVFFNYVKAELKELEKFKQYFLTR